jgi:hypothetical protein
MARYAHARNSFTMGEVSPRFLGRTDTEQYRQACSYLQNFNVLPVGGVQKRMGTEFIIEVPVGHDMDTLVLIPFDEITGNLIFAVSDSYISMHDQASGATIDGEATGFAGGHTIQFTQRGLFLILTNGQALPMVIAVTPLTSFTIYTYGVTELTGLADPSANGTGAGLSTIIESHRNLPWFKENTTATTLAITSGTAAIGAGKTLTASGAIFTPSMVGQYIRVRHTADIGVCKITAYTSSTVVTIEIFRTFGATTATTTWSFAQWGPVYGYPRACTFHQERLYFAGSGSFRDRTWATQQGDMWELSNPDPTDVEAVGDTFGHYFDGYFGKSALINFLSTGKNIFVGTTSGEAILNEINEDYSLGLLNTKVVLQTETGSTFPSYVRHENKLVFIQRSLRKLVELFFDFEEETYKPRDLNELADHLFAAGGISTTKSIRWISFQPDRKILWVLTTSYELFSCTRNTETDMIAWSRHTIGGTAATGGIYANTTTPAVLAICNTSNITYGFDEMWVAVARRINGGNKIYLEKLSIPDSDSQDTEDTPDNYLDSSADAVGASATAWAAIAAHLPSETVHVVADGIYVGTKTLNGSGDLTLDTAATSVAVGYNYRARGIITPLESNALFGSGLGSVKRTDEVTFVLDRTSSLEFGTYENIDDLETIDFRDSTVSASDPTPLFTGEKTRKLRGNYEENQSIVFESTDPLPCTVAAIVLKGILYD